MSEQDEQVDSSTTDDVVEDPSTSVESDETAEASAETENTEAAASPGKGAEKRIKQLLAERKEARERAESLERRLVDLEAKLQSNGKAETKAEAKDESPPAGLSATEQVQWYVENFGRRFIERELGMDLGTVKALLGSTKATAEDYATRQWSSLCAEHGLDPADETTQRIAAGLMKGQGVSPREAMKTIAGLMGKKGSAVQNKDTKKRATVEVDGQTETMTDELVLAKDTKHALDLAHKGVRVTQLPTSEIIRRRLERQGK